MRLTEAGIQPDEGNVTNVAGSGSTTGIGGTGTYFVSQNQTISSSSMSTGSLTTYEMIHPSCIENEQIRDRGAAFLNMITR